MRSGCRRLASAVSILGDHRRTRRERAAALLHELDPSDGIRAEGDMELYSDAELHKRADLRYAPEITAHLDEWWRAASKYVERDDDDDSIRWYLTPRLVALDSDADCGTGDAWTYLGGRRATGSGLWRDRDR